MTNRIFFVKTALLDFDYDNPRLVEDTDNSHNDEETIRFLSSQYDLQELVDSITSNTYLTFEPIIVKKKNDDAGRYMVLEGNRRLAAIRVIQDKTLARSFKISLPDVIPPDVLNSIIEIGAIEVADKEEARSYIGFKHINGSNKWNSFAKAKYVTDWYLRGTPIEDIAKKVGDTNQTVRNLIGGMLVLNQAEQNDIFDIKDRTKVGAFGFSHLYTALNRAEYKEFLNLEKNWSQQPTQKPVPEDKLDNLKTMLQFIYGSKMDGVRSVIESQNPDLKNLGYVLVNPTALIKLKQTNNLDDALEDTKSKDMLFEENIVAANTALEKAMKTISGYKGHNEKVLEICQTIVFNAQAIEAIVQKKANAS
jgi:ParB-like chromosome segregation protein Spo0J